VSYRSEREKPGFVKVFFRDGTNSVIARNEFAPLCAALKAGHEWYDALDLWGDPEMIRLACVAKVAEATPSGIAAFDAEAAEEVAYKTAHGEE
jgi:hypothetical protein